MIKFSKDETIIKRKEYTVPDGVYFFKFIDPEDGENNVTYYKYIITKDNWDRIIVKNFEDNKTINILINDFGMNFTFQRNFSYEVGVSDSNEEEFLKNYNEVLEYLKNIKL